jgi:hypothetical protein
MTISLRKGDELVYITYLDDRLGSRLYASDFRLDADDKRVLLSMDFSKNERSRSKDGTLYRAAKELIAQVSDIKSVQIPINKWFGIFESQLEEFPGALRELELRFKDAPSRIYRYDLRTEEFSAVFTVTRNEGPK